MIDYEIIKADATLNQIQVMYTKEGKPPYFVSIGMDEGFTEADAHEAAQSRLNTEAVFWYWSRVDNTVEITNTTGQAKTVIMDPQPQYDISTHVAEETVTETDSEITVGYTVRERSVAEMAIKARNRRDHLLAITDAYGFSDRVMTPEMTAYRQALRDVPQQEGFPVTIEWPIQPID